MKHLLDLQALFGQGYKIAADPAGRRGSDDPWLWTIPCRHGDIYPHGGDLLCVWVNGARKISSMLTAIPELQRHQMGDAEAVLLFPMDLFSRVAKFVKPYRKRRLSAPHRLRLVGAGRAHRYNPLATGLIDTSGLKEPRSRSGWYQSPSRTRGRD